MKACVFILAGVLAAFALPAFAAGEPPVKLEKVDAEKLPPPTLTLQNALARAQRKSPGALAAHARGHAAEANVEQAGAPPNPEISVEAENIMGSGPYDGFEDAEITYGVTQTLETPGKRGGRVNVAGAQRDQSHFTEDSTQLDLIRDVTIAYAAIAAGENDVRILEDDERRARAVHDSVAAKVYAGKEPPIQKTKANVALSSATIALDRARRDLEARYAKLSALMGEGGSVFTIDAASLPGMTIPDTLDSYRARTRGGTDIAAMQAMVAEAKAALSLEKANAVPDPTFMIGVRDFRGDNEQALVAGISFPIPVFNANRAGIRRAGHELNAAMLDERGAQLSLDALVKEVYGNFVSAYRETEMLKDTVVPGAEEAFAIAREGYDAGKFEYLDVLDAQRTLFDARRQLIASTLDYHHQRTMLERMTTTHDDHHQNAKKDKKQ